MLTNNYCWNDFDYKWSQIVIVYEILHFRSFSMSVNEDGTMGNVTIPAGTLPILDGEEVMYVCLKSGKTGYFHHQGTAKSLQVTNKTTILKSVSRPFANYIPPNQKLSLKFEFCVSPTDCLRTLRGTHGPGWERLI